MRVRPRRRVSRVDEVAIHRADRKALVVDDVHARVRIPARREVRDVLAVDRPLGRSTLWRSDHVTCERERNGHRRRGHYAEHGPRSPFGHGQRGERGEARGNAVQGGCPEPRQGDEGEKTPRGRTGQVPGVENTRARRILAKAANDDPAREHERKSTRDVRNEDRRGQCRARIDVRLEKERDDRAGRRCQRERCEPRPPWVSIEDAAQRCTAADPEKSDADDEVRQVIAV